MYLFFFFHKKHFHGCEISRRLTSQGVSKDTEYI